MRITTPFQLFMAALWLAVNLYWLVYSHGELLVRCVRNTAVGWTAMLATWAVAGFVERKVDRLAAVVVNWAMLSMLLTCFLTYHRLGRLNSFEYMIEGVIAQDIWRDFKCGIILFVLGPLELLSCWYIIRLAVRILGWIIRKLE